MVSRVLAAFGVAVTVSGCVSSAAAQGQPAGGHVHYVPPPPAQAAQTSARAVRSPHVCRISVRTRSRSRRAIVTRRRS